MTENERREAMNALVRLATDALPNHLIVLVALDQDDDVYMNSGIDHNLTSPLGVVEMLEQVLTFYKAKIN